MVYQQAFFSSCHYNSLCYRVVSEQQFQRQVKGESNKLLGYLLVIIHEVFE